jgi:hypothetical protein
MSLRISIQAMNAITDVMNVYKNDTSRSVVLFAQMQSGKTNAFLFLAGEMLRLEKVENVVIFSGNRETELKDQLSELEISRFYERVYRRHLEKLNVDISDEFIDHIVSKINVVWGTELMKKLETVATKNTLYIEEESHFAQSVGQMPHKFIKSIGLSLNGDSTALIERNNYVCSVSATPFSEMSDVVHLNQNKKIVFMRPGESYRGVSWYKEHDKIVGFDKWQEKLQEIIASPVAETPKWAIIRVRGEAQVDEVKAMCASSNWSAVRYDQGNKGELKSLKDLATPPEVNTIVIIKELCRMGTVVPKQHISFVMETSTNPRTDTVLQGLLGRMCGYPGGSFGYCVSNDINIYISQQVLSNGDIDTYISLCQSMEMTILPSRATNVIGEHNKGRRDLSHVEPIIPIYMRELSFPDKNDPNSCLPDVIIALRSQQCENGNSPNVTQRVIHFLDGQVSGVVNRDLTRKTFKKMIPRIKKSMHENIPFNTLSSGSGIDTNKLTIFKSTSNDDIRQGFYLFCFIPRLAEEVAVANPLKKMIPKTNGREIFGYTTETGTFNKSNGTCGVSLRPETATDISEMSDSIRECIRMSLEPSSALIHSRSISSNFSVEEGGWNGIYISENVYKALIPGGTIYNDIKREFSIKIKIAKVRGRQTKKYPIGCSVRIAQISW